jgi:hypothetical protein
MDRVEAFSESFSDKAFDFNWRFPLRSPFRKGPRLRASQKGNSGLVRIYNGPVNSIAYSRNW